MSHLVRLRVTLADRPGSLATVATIIATHGGNITGVDVLSEGGDTVVDEITVAFTDLPDLAALRATLAEGGGATLQSHREASQTDLLTQVLRRLGDLVERRPRPGGDELARGVAELCSSPAVWIARGEEALRHETGRFALERNGAVTVRTFDLPGDMATTVPGEAWLLAVPDPHLSPEGRVVFVARPLELAFTATEIMRIEALMAFHDALDALSS